MEKITSKKNKEKSFARFVLVTFVLFGVFGFVSGAECTCGSEVVIESGSTSTSTAYSDSTSTTTSGSATATANASSSSSSTSYVYFSIIDCECPDAQQDFCFSEILDLDYSIRANDLDVDVEVKSPFNQDYFSKLTSDQIQDYFTSRVDVYAEVSRRSDGYVVYSDFAVARPELYGSDVVNFYVDGLADGSYTFTVWTSLQGEDRCLDYDFDEDGFDFDILIYDNDKDDDGYTEDVDCDDYNPNVWRFLNGYTDYDLDTYGAGSRLSICSGNFLPEGYASRAGDCDDYNFYVNPGRSEICNDGIDNNCNGIVDENCEDPNDCDSSDPHVWQYLVGYVDNDGDYFGAGAALDVCSGNSLPDGYVDNNDDCDDLDFNVNPGEQEVCNDGIDNNCDGVVDENCGEPLRIISVTASPLEGFAPLDVSFECRASGGEGELSYSWDFDDGGLDEGASAQYTFDDAGDYEVVCSVSDENENTVSGSVDVHVEPRILEIVDMTCFDDVIVGHNQSCSVYVEDSLGRKVGGASVYVYYEDGSSFGSCTTNLINGACGVKDLQNEEGEVEVYAVAFMSGAVADDDRETRYTYDVLAEEYIIDDLKVFSDEAYSVEDYDFFRGEALYASFSVDDLDGFLVEDNMISQVSLVSGDAGGRIDLELVEFSSGVYYYRLDGVPITHDFIGDSNVFAFVFDFVNSAGGQEEVSMVIRNNLPEIYNIGERSVDEGDSFMINLANYESDVEDSGDALTWEVVSFGSCVDAALDDKVLRVEGLNEDVCNIVLRLWDLDNAYDEVTFEVRVESGGSSSGTTTSDCDSDWKCSAWGECVNGFMVRDCVDLEDCSSSRDRPLEVQSCSSFTFGEGNSSVLRLGDFSTAEEKKGLFDGFNWVVWSLIFLIAAVLIAILVVYFLKN